jgi:predicted permease
MFPIDLFRALLQRRRIARELDDELAFHVEMETQANIARGMSPEDARLTALRAFGGVIQTKERVRDVRALCVESLWQDVRQGARLLRVHWGFTLTAAGMLALGVGITTAMFTIVDALILRPVPFRGSDQLARVYMGNDHGGRFVVKPAVVKAWRQTRGFVAAESAMDDTALIEIGPTVVERGIATVTPGVFDMLGGVQPIRGRLFSEDEGRAGASDRVLVSETVWRTLYGAEPALVGQSITVDGDRLTVVGILPGDFRFPSAETVLWRPTDLASEPDEWAIAYVRFDPDVPRADALRLGTNAARAADPQTAALRTRVDPLDSRSDRYSKQAVPLLAGSVVLVLLVLCANVSGLLLARLTNRRREFSMRAALGASRSRLIRQALVESGLLGVLGIALGVAVAWALVSIAQAIIPEPLLLQTLNSIDLDTRALAAAAAAGLTATFAAGLLPAWLGTAVDAGDSLRVADLTRTDSRGARVLARALLVGEVALACTLLVAATQLTRSFVNLAHADRGLDTSGVMTLWLSIVPAGPNAGAVPDAAARNAIGRSIEDDLRQLPGVRQVAWSYGLPPRGGIETEGDWLSDLPGAHAINAEVTHYVVSPQFFSLYEIPIIRGRTFVASDPYERVIVSEEWARMLWPGVDPVGHTFSVDKDRFEVIGVARDIHYPAIDRRLDGPEFYHPYTAIGPTPMVSVRCEPRCPDAAWIRHRLAEAHPTVHVQEAGPVEAKYAAQLARPRASAALAGTFAVIAIVAAAAGLFSVLSYAVTRRKREFGIRSAIGASPQEIRRGVLRDGAVIGAFGGTFGVILGAVFARALASLQYGVSVSDPLTWSIVLAVIALTTTMASWGPARTAARLDPLTLLREE